MAKKFKKNDQVLVISGSNKGKIGKISQIQNDRVVIEGVNIATIHEKPSSNSPGQIKKVEKPVHISNISHVENGKAVKIAFKIETGEDKVFLRKSRVSKKTGKKIG